MAWGILDGINVVEMASGLAGPLAARLLAEQGAEVIKVEPLDGDLMRTEAAFASWNRSKKSVMLDIDRPDDLRQLHALVARADVFIHCLRPARARAVGLGDRELAARYPNLIVAAVLGYPVDHRDVDQPGYDILVQARTGVMDEVVGNREGPIFLRFPLPSWPTAYLAAIGILARLVVREQTGRAGPAHTSLLQGTAALATMLWNRAERPSEALRAKVPLPKHEHGMALSMFECADGEWLQTLLGYTEHPLTLETLAEMGEEPIIVENFRPSAGELEVFRRAFKRRPRQEWLEAFYEGGVSAAPLSHVGELLSDPDVLLNGYTVELDDPVWGRVRQANCAFRTEPPAAVTGPAPRLGEHQGAAFSRSFGRSMSPQGSYPRTRLLEGLRVLDFGMYVAGPFGPTLLADLGADVIKVEPLDGDRVRPLEMLFAGFQRGRRSIAVDGADPVGRKIIERLVGWADVVHHNMRPSAARRLGLDEPSLRAINPDIIYCHVSAYGYLGSRAEWPSYDATAQAMSGWPKESVGPGERPMNYRFGMFDPLTAMASVVPILLAMYGRARHLDVGLGVSTSLLAAVTESNSETMLLLDTGDLAPFARVDAAQTGISPGYRIYRAGDGWIAVAAVTPAQVAAFRQVVGAASDADLEQAVAGWEPAALAKELRAAGVPGELVRTDHEQAFFDAESGPNGVAITLRHPEYGRMQVPGHFWRFGDLENGSSRPAPLLGEHTAEILRELGFTDDEMAGFARLGLIVPPAPEISRHGTDIATPRFATPG